MRYSWKTFLLLEPLEATRLELGELFSRHRARPLDVSTSVETDGWVYNGSGDPIGDPCDLDQVFVGPLIVALLRFEWVTVPWRLIRTERDARVRALEESRGVELTSEERTAIEDDVRLQLRKRALPETESVRVVINEAARRVYVMSCPTKRLDRVIDRLEELGCKLEPFGAELATGLVTPRIWNREAKRLSELAIGEDEFGAAMLEWLYYVVASSYTPGMVEGLALVELSEDAREFAPRGPAGRWDPPTHVAVGFRNGVTLEPRNGGRGRTSIRDDDPATSLEVRNARKLGKWITAARLAVHWHARPPEGETSDEGGTREFELGLKAKGLTVSGVKFDAMAFERDDVEGMGDSYLADQESLMEECDALVLALVRTYLTLREGGAGWHELSERMFQWREAGGPWAELPEKGPEPSTRAAVEATGGRIVDTLERAGAELRSSLKNLAGPGGTVTVTSGGRTVEITG